MQSQITGWCSFRECLVYTPCCQVGRPRASSPTQCGTHMPCCQVGRPWASSPTQECGTGGVQCLEGVIRYGRVHPLQTTLTSGFPRS